MFFAAFTGFLALLHFLPMSHASSLRRCSARFLPAALALSALGAFSMGAAQAQQAQPAQAAACKPLYLVFELGDMRTAQLTAITLQQTRTPATFLVSDTPAVAPGGQEVSTSALSRQWAPWWQARGQEGHAFAVQPLDLPQWRGDLPGRVPSFRMRMQHGGLAGREFTWDGAKYCASLNASAERVEHYAGKPALPLFHAPGGKTSARLLQTAQGCGFKHVSLPAQLFAGDAVSGEALLKRAQSVQEGDILLSHLGAWPGQDPAAATALAPLLQNLKSRGYCFKTLDQHPQYR